MKRFDGKTTKNARIKIDYSGKKPDVVFSYPDKKNQVEQTMAVYIFFISLLLGTFFWGGYDTASGLVPNTEFEAPPQNYSDYKEYYHNKLNQSYADSQRGTWDVILEVTKENQAKFIIFFLFAVVIPSVVYFPFKKHWNTLTPKLNAKLPGKTKYMEFKPKDVVVNGKEIYCEVPLFKNVMLKYKAQKDFSKQLKYFEIEEFKFYTSRVPTKKNKKRKKLNEFLWYARFYFKQKPTTGKLLVMFK